MSALMSDLIEGSIAPGTSNAAVNAGGKLLKVVEMQLKYGKKVGTDGNRELILCGSPDISEAISSKEEEMKELERLKNEAESALQRLAEAQAKFSR